MKKSNFNKLISLGICAVFTFALAITLTGCKNDGLVQPDPPVKYTVSVQNGTGGGEFKKDKLCTVSASVPEGKVFSKWLVGGEVVSSDNPYTFAVDKDITITAITGITYNLKVEGGKIGDTTDMEADIVEGETVTINAKSTAAKTFLYWLIDGATKITDSSYTFVLSKDTEAQAIFDEVCLISVADGVVYLPDGQDNAARSQRVAMGDDCTISANAAPLGQKFAYWYYIDENKKEVKISETADFTFKVVASRKIYAKYDYFYFVSVEDGYINDNTLLTSAEIKVNTDIIITAIIPDGKGFSGWELNGSIVSKSINYTLKVTADISLKAVFADHIQLDAPKNNENQMFKYLGYGDSRNTTEFDRQKNTDGSRKTVFVDGVDYILYHVYTSSAADKNSGAVATFKLVRDANGNAKIIAMNGSVSIGCGSEPGNYYIDNTSKVTFFAFFKAVLGDNYRASQSYYFAAQVIAKENSVFLNSEISEIGTSSIKEG